MLDLEVWDYLYY